MNEKKLIDNLCGLKHTQNKGDLRVKMAKTGTLNKRKNLTTKQLASRLPFTSPEVKNSKLVSDTLLECIRSGDLNAFREVLASYIMSTNKVQLSQKSGIGRRTLYDILDPEINFNPALSTVSAIIRGLAE